MSKTRLLQRVTRKKTFHGDTRALTSHAQPRLPSCSALDRAAAQESVAQFYRGKTITIIAASSAGGGYDLYARTIARHIGKHLPGNPNVVVSNMPGAASNVAAAYIYNAAPKDGTVIGGLFMGAVVEPLFSGRTRATHDMSKFHTSATPTRTSMSAWCAPAHR